MFIVSNILRKYGKTIWDDFWDRFSTPFAAVPQSIVYGNIRSVKFFHRLDISNILIKLQRVSLNIKIMMTKITDLSAVDARAFLMRAKCYFRQDFPPYISFQSILDDVDKALGGHSYRSFQKSDIKPENLSGVNYQFLANKDGRFAWRPFELIHPAIYVSLVNLMCEEANWNIISERFKKTEGNRVECCSIPVVPKETETNDGAQVLNWWLEYEQKALELSLEYSHVLQTDVTDCYGALYTHSIAWALHGIEEAKSKKGKSSLLGNNIDSHVTCSRYGQTNGIVQGSVVMDIIAELVLGFVDDVITENLPSSINVRILRYRDDYRIFSLNDGDAEKVLKIVSDSLRIVGMKLGASKTSSSTNVVEASIKPEKLAGMHLADMDINEAKTIQKQLMRLHAFARSYPNSGALNRLSSAAFEKISGIIEVPKDIAVQIAIVTDIVAISPQAFPALSGIIAKLISLSPEDERVKLWQKVSSKLRLIPHNGYLEIWLQRVTRAKGVEVIFDSSEKICRVIEGENVELWDNSWISSEKLLKALDVNKIKTGDPSEFNPVPEISEVSLFKIYAEFS